MDKVWVINIPTNNIDKVGSFDSGPANWKKAYQEMIKRGYKFEIGSQRGNNGDYCGLYIVNPSDIKIEKSEFDVVNKVNEEIKRIQEKNNSQKKSLGDLIASLERTVASASRSDLELQFAPPEAIEGLIKNQEVAYNKLIEALKTSLQEERQGILGRVFYSNILTDNIKLGILFEINSLSNDQVNKNINNQELINLFNQLEKKCIYAARSQIELQFAPPGAIEGLITDQENAYNTFIDALESSTQEERQSIIKRVFDSNSITDNTKLAIIAKITELSQETSRRR